MRRRSSSKRRYSRGGSPEHVTEINDLYAKYYSRYEILTKIGKSRHVELEGDLADLDDETKQSLFNKYANKRDYEFIVV